MKAAVLGENGVEVRDLPKPDPKPNEVVIRVHASSLNRADLLVSLGHQHGRIVNIGRLAGMKAEFDFDAHARQRIDYIGVTFRTRTIEEVREILIKMRADLWDDVKAGRIKVPIDKTYPLAEAKAGHEHMRTNQHFGKILLIP